MPGLGFCYPIRSQIVAVRARLARGQSRPQSGRLISSHDAQARSSPSDKSGENSQVRQAHRSTSTTRRRSWLERASSGSRIGSIKTSSLIVNNASKPIKRHARARPVLVLSRTAVSNSRRSGRILPAQGFTQALNSGYDRTIRTVMIVYSTFRSLVQRRVSPKHLGGPIMIFQMGYSAAGTKLQHPGVLPGHPEHQPGGAQLPAHPAAGRRADGILDRRESARPAPARFGRDRRVVGRIGPRALPDGIRHLSGYLPNHLWLVVVSVQARRARPSSLYPCRFKRRKALPWESFEIASTPVYGAQLDRRREGRLRYYRPARERRVARGQGRMDWRLSI